MSKPLVKTENLKKYFPVTRGISLFSRVKKFVHAVDGVSFKINKGETFGLIGESGCGKTTVARLVLRLLEPTNGTVYFESQNIFELNKREMRKLRRDMQIVFQDPTASLNPRMIIEEIIGEPLRNTFGNQPDNREKVAKVMERVGLYPAQQFFRRYPHEFSVGQRQRIAIARALITKPKFVVADEPVSSLDMSVKSQILNSMRELKEEYDLTYLLIAHDLAVVRYMCDWIAIMYLGRIVESAPAKLFFTSLHPYTRALISAFPVPDPDVKRERITLKGEVPSPIELPQGCKFNPRCPYREPECAKLEPKLTEVREQHYVACHKYSYG